MASVTKAFTAKGAGDILKVPVGQAFTYDLSGTFSATVVLEQLEKGKGPWRTLVSSTGAAKSGTLVAEESGKTHATLRFRCTAFTSGTANAVVADVTNEVTDQVLPDEDGNPTFDISDLGAHLREGKALLASQTVGAGGSYQPVAIDLEVATDGGSDDGTAPSFLAPVMGHILGGEVDREGNYLAGVIGASSITDPVSDYPVAPVLAILMDGAAQHDSIVHAHIDGADPSAVTHANAAFGVSQANDHAGSGVDYGLDLKGAANAHITGGLAFACKKAELRASVGDVVVMAGDGAPTSGASGTGDNFAGKGSLYIDYTNANHYIQIGAITSPDWKLVTRAS